MRHDEVERRDAVRVHVGEVRLLAAVGEDPAVHLRVQRDHAVIEHLGEAGDVGERSSTGMPASAIAVAVPPDDTSSQPSSCKPAGEVDEPGLVADGEQRAHQTSFFVVGVIVVGRHELVEHRGIEAALDLLDALVQRLDGVVGQHRHRLLGEDRAVVDLEAWRRARCSP